MYSEVWVVWPSLETKWSVTRWNVWVRGIVTIWYGISGVAYIWGCCMLDVVRCEWAVEHEGYNCIQRCERGEVCGSELSTSIRWELLGSYCDCVCLCLCMRARACVQNVVITFDGFAKYFDRLQHLLYVCFFLLCGRDWFDVLRVTASLDFIA